MGFKAPKVFETFVSAISPSRLIDILLKPVILFNLSGCRFSNLPHCVPSPFKGEGRDEGKNYQEREFKLIFLR